MSILLLKMPVEISQLGPFILGLIYQEPLLLQVTMKNSGRAAIIIAE